MIALHCFQFAFPSALRILLTIINDSTRNGQRFSKVSSILKRKNGSIAQIFHFHFQDTQKTEELIGIIRHLQKGQTFFRPLLIY